jgi:hypothetical protein
VRYLKFFTDLTRVLFALISHHARPANDFEIGNLRQLGQKIVLDTVGKGSVLLVVTQVFKRKHCDPSCRRAVEQIAFPNDYAQRCYQGERQRDHRRNSWISL